MEGIGPGDCVDRLCLEVKRRRKQGRGGADGVARTLVFLGIGEAACILWAADRVRNLTLRGGRNSRPSKVLRLLLLATLAVVNREPRRRAGGGPGRRWQRVRVCNGRDDGRVHRVTAIAVSGRIAVSMPIQSAVAVAIRRLRRLAVLV